MNVKNSVPGQNFKDRDEFKAPAGKRSCQRSSMRGRELTGGSQGPSFTFHSCPTSKMRFAHLNIQERSFTMNKHKRKSILRMSLMFSERALLFVVWDEKYPLFFITRTITQLLDSTAVGSTKKSDAHCLEYAQNQPFIAHLQPVQRSTKKKYNCDPSS